MTTAVLIFFCANLVWNAAQYVTTKMCDENSTFDFFRNIATLLAFCYLIKFF